MANEYIRKQYVGGAAQTTITGAIDADDTSITVASAAGWPSGPTPFCVTLDVNTATEEMLLVTRSGTTLTVVERGYDNTVAAAHDSGATCIHAHDAWTDDQANRLANLQTVKGAMIIHNGTNPVEYDPELVGDGSDDGKILKTKDANETGFEIAYPDVVNTDASAPVATSETLYGLWGDDTLKILRWLKSAAWMLPNNLYAAASLGALNVILTAPRAGQLGQIGDDIIVRWNAEAQQWRTVGMAIFDNASDRNAFYADATVGLYDGARAYTLDDHAEYQYRDDEWVLMNQKITVSDEPPADPHVGDVWMRPVS